MTKSIFHRYTWIKKVLQTREFGIMLFFGVLLCILIFRLVWLQIITTKEYQKILSLQHTRKTEINAQRGNIYVIDKSKKEIKLTENVTLYNLVIYPEDMRNKSKVITLITPIVYYHFCKQYGLVKPTKLECIKNIEKFTRTKILPPEPQFFYYASGVISKNYFTFDRTGYNAEYKKAYENFSQEFAMELIRKRLEKMIKRGYTEYNNIGFFDNPAFLEEVAKLPYIIINNKNYVNIKYADIQKYRKTIIQDLTALFKKYGYENLIETLPKKLERQRYKYIKIISNANPVIGKVVKKLKAQYYTERIDGIPLLHCLGLEEVYRRYYPFDSFMANVLGYVTYENNTIVPHKGVEAYFDELLRGKPGEIYGRSSIRIGDVGSNEFTIKNPINGKNIYLTIDPSIQKEVEKIAETYHKKLQADSVSILIYDPFSGAIKASANYPTFNPNKPGEASELMPLSPEYSHLLTNPTFVDIPVYMLSGDTLEEVTYKDERRASINPKYIHKNIYGSTVFIDKNIAYSYNPGSIFKVITFAIGLDTKEITPYDYYEDLRNFITIDQFKIANANRACQGIHNFLYALQYSCNVGLRKIIEKVTKHVFYNYLQKLGFGQLTNIELADEDPGMVPNATNVAKATLSNNAFGMDIFVTPLQLAVAYGAIFNGGEILKPTIIDKICDPETNVCYQNKKKVIRKVFSPDIKNEVGYALVEVLKTKENNFLQISGYSLGGKSGTSPIVFSSKFWKKNQYMQGNGRTNTSFMGIVTQKNLKYIVIVQVRRPRIDQRGSKTAGLVFKDVASFLIGYDLLNE